MPRSSASRALFRSWSKSVVALSNESQGMVSLSQQFGTSGPTKELSFKSRSRESCAEYVLRSVNASLTLSLAATLSQRRSWLLQGRDGVLSLTRARRCSAWQDKSPRELRERLVAHSSSAVALIVFIGTYFAAAAIYFAVIALAVDARARAFKSLSRGMLPPLGELLR